MEETGKGMRQVTIEDVVSIFKNFSDTKTMAQIKSAMVAKFTPEGNCSVRMRTSSATKWKESSKKTRSWGILRNSRTTKGSTGKEKTSPQ